MPGYSLDAVLGWGGMGVVYKAWHTRLNRPVALKMILGGRYAGPTVRLRFQIEAEAVAQLRHPHIVQLYEYGEHDAQPFFALEFVDGGTLAEKLKRDGRMAPQTAAALVAKLADAVAAAHAKGIVHRDLKPANILLTADGEPKVTDFGLAKVGQSDMTDTGAVMGTPCYMSPEQAAGKTREIGTPTDVYALGVILYELITGRTPFRGDTPADTLRQVLTGDPTAPRSLVGGIPLDLDTICLKCLERSPAKRYPTAEALATELRDYLHGRPITARPVGTAERVTKWVRRHPGRAAAVAVLSLAALAAAITANVVHEQKAALLAEGEEKTRQQQRTDKADALVRSLTVADTVEVPRILDEMKDYRDLTGPALLDLSKRPITTRPGLHARLALLRDDPTLVPELVGYIPVCQPEELLPLRDLLAPFANAADDPLWEVARNEALAPDRRLRATCALAAFAPHDPRWAWIATGTVDRLVRQNPLEAVVWAQALEPARAVLLPALVRRYSDLRTRIHSRRLDDDTAAGEASAFDLTASVMARYASRTPADLAELAIILDARHYHLCNEAITANKTAVIPLLQAELTREAAQDWAGVSAETPFGVSDAAVAGPSAALAVAVPDAAFDRVDRRRAAAVAALVKLGETDVVWPLMRGSSDPSVRAYIMHRLAGIGVDPLVLIDRFTVETDLSARRSLMLALGEYPPGSLPKPVRSAAIGRLLTVYREQPHAGQHGAIDWVLRNRFDRAAEVDLIDEEIAEATRGTNPAEGDKDWYANGQGQTFTIIRGPVRAVLGSPATEPDRVPEYETPHALDIPRTFAIATKEVTAEQFLRFRPKHTWTKEYGPHPDGPVPAVSWPTAAEYCNWLSEREGIPKDQWCYEPNAAHEYAVGMRAKPGHLSLTGYRLPTDAEWEYACRAGSAVARSYGRSAELLPKYGWYLRNAGNQAQPVGRLKPNDFGMFDMLGNILEWVDDPARAYDPARTADGEYPDALTFATDHDRYPRGGAFNYSAAALRNGHRFLNWADYRLVSVGIRPARTLQTASPAVRE